MALEHVELLAREMSLWPDNTEGFPNVPVKSVSTSSKKRSERERT